MDATVIDAVTRLVQVLGPDRSLALAVFLTVAVAAWKRYQDKKKEKAESKLLNAKEEEIARLAEDNRAWRRYFLEGLGLSEGEIARLGINSAPADPITAETNVMVSAPKRLASKKRRAQKGKE